MTVRSCIKSMRLRTLPLSLAGIVAGVSLASQQGSLNAAVVAALVVTTILLQVLSNISNELGDCLHGTDTDDRQGIHYSLQDGDITVPQMKVLIGVVAGLCCASGLAMLVLSFGLEPIWPLAAFTLFGAATIWAAMRYTLGKNPYGYRGLGDISVFVFFGLANTLGAAFICSHTFNPLWILPAAAFGCWSVGVLNVNNIRDMKTDAATRVTTALKMGVRKARIYQTLLVAGGWVLMLIYTALAGHGIQEWIYVIVIPVSVLHIRGVWKHSDRELDPLLPMLVMSTFAIALLFCVGNAL